MRILGLDVGEKRIGVAKVDSETRIAVPVGFVLVDGSEWQEIAKLAELNNTSLFVLGLPRSNEGNETKQTLFVRQFAKNLLEKIPDAKIRFQDESLTSVEAESRLKKRKKKYEKGEIDAEAATIILQDFVENFKVADVRSEESASDFSENTKKIAKKEAKKIALNAKKVGNQTKKISKFFVIPPILLVAILVSVTVTLKYRDYVRQQREEEYARQEAEMQAKTFDFTIRPGETIYDIKNNLLKVNRNGDVTDEEPLPNYTEVEIDTAFAADYDFDFLKNRPDGATLEGYLYPETHNFYGESTVEEVLEVFLSEMEKVINENNLEAAYAEHGLTLHEGITLASVVQKEASSLEQPTVAQVFLLRLDYGWRLGSDVTVTYALDTVDPEREIYVDNQAALQIDSCYNTRLYAGLPCGPISNPGLNALLAVANPTDTAYLYFLTGDDGVMYYSYTEAEHNQNAYLHCQTLCNVSL
ncbi:endolytic transglycosylase MltG [Candidatus Saccharibacteria bacterium]|nr:endolytic transglycosylase MltG [Candidatus Saccharibacteria bacterium]